MPILTWYRRAETVIAIDSREDEPPAFVEWLPTADGGYTPLSEQPDSIPREEDAFNAWLLDNVDHVEAARDRWKSGLA